MKNTTLLQILKYWNELSYKEKADILQRFEIENSKMQKREARELVIDPNMRDDVGGLFSYNTPEIIKIPHPTLLDGTRMANAVTHEGYHAYIYDHLQDKCDLNLYSNINIEDFYKEKKYDTKLIHLLKNYQDGEILFSLFGMEECLVEKETALHLIYNIIKSCNNKCELLNISDYINQVLEDQSYRESAKIVYSEDKFKSIRALCMEVIKINTDKFYTTKKINKNLYPKLVENFEENLRLFVLSRQYPETFDQLKIGMQIGKNLLDLYDEPEMNK